MNLRAFTIVEMMFAMVLASIVISLGFWSFNRFAKGYFAQSESIQSLRQARDLHFALNNDLFNAQSVTLDVNSFHIQQMEKMIVYQMLSDSIIIRDHQNPTDTFKLMNLDMNYSYQGKEVNELDQPIDEIQIEYEQNNKKQKMIATFNPDAQLKWQYE